MMLRSSRAPAAALLAVTMLSACGSSQRTPVASRLEREDFTALTNALTPIGPALAREVAATKAAWSLIVKGLAPPLSADARARLEAAAASAQMVVLPPLLQEASAATLTGPASHLAGLVRSYQALAARGWRMIVAGAHALEAGPANAARFARANVGLYIESVYDAHFSLAQLGIQLLDSYRRLGGADSFGAQPGESEVQALAQTYSEANDRLQPHVGVRVGS